jgi:hypothetical protein
MTQETLVKLVSQLELLDPEELQGLSQAINLRLNAIHKINGMAGFYNSLLASGLIRQINRINPQSQIQRSLVEAIGKPVSETIIEERR